MGAEIRILAIDDHALFREGLVRLLGSEPDFRIVAQCDSVTQAMDFLSRNDIDLLLLDYDLGEETGIGLVRWLRGRDERVKTLVMTGGISETSTLDILTAGASGIFFKQGDANRLFEAIRRVSHGEIWLDHRVLYSLLAGSRKQIKEGTQESALSSRQQDVLSGILDGLSTKEIAWKLQVSATTIKVAMQELFARAGVRSRSQLVRIALEKREAGPLGRIPGQRS